MIPITEPKQRARSSDVRERGYVHDVDLRASQRG